MQAVLSSRIIIGESNALECEGLAAILSSTDKLQVVRKVHDGPSVIRSVAALDPDIVVMNESMPLMDGYSTLRRIRLSYPRTKVLLVSSNAALGTVQQARDAGASGIIVSSDAVTKLCDAVNDILSADAWINSGTAPAPATGTLHWSRVRARTGVNILSPREKQVLSLVSEGLTSRLIAERLEVRPRTVEVHRHNIQEKLGVRSVAELVKFAIRHGLAHL
jgi:DNA-binding NarL/FixJ family response regulator